MRSMACPFSGVRGVVVLLYACRLFDVRSPWASESVGEGVCGEVLWAMLVERRERSG
jgi:hypothetical protein